MKVAFFLLFGLMEVCSAVLFAQTETEIFALSMQSIDGNLSFGSPENITNNSGYDSQPSFFDANTLLFSSTQNGQTDIARYSFENKTKTWLSSTPEGSEYSPLLIPGDQAVSAIRLDTTGLQRLYRYPLSGEKSKPIFEEAKIGYHVWINARQLIATVLVDNRMDLSFADIEKGSIVNVFQDVGRSLHRIPNSNKLSFVQTTEERSTIYAFDPLTGQIESLIALGFSIVDMYWFSATTFLYSSGTKIYALDVSSNEVTLFYQSSLANVEQITRLLISPDKTQLIFVGE